MSYVIEPRRGLFTAGSRPSTGVRPSTASLASSGRRFMTDYGTDPTLGKSVLFAHNHTKINNRPRTAQRTMAMLGGGIDVGGARSLGTGLYGNGGRRKFEPKPSKPEEIRFGRRPLAPPESCHAKQSAKRVIHHPRAERRETFGKLITRDSNELSTAIARIEDMMTRKRVVEPPPSKRYDINKAMGQKKRVNRPRPMSSFKSPEYMPGYFHVKREEKDTRAMVKKMKDKAAGKKSPTAGRAKGGGKVRRVRVSYEDKQAARQKKLDQSDVNELDKWEEKTGNQLDSDEDEERFAEFTRNKKPKQRPERSEVAKTIPVLKVREPSSDDGEGDGSDDDDSDAD